MPALLTGPIDAGAGGDRQARGPFPSRPDAAPRRAHAGRQSDAGSSIGSIRQASQGLFQILARDEAPGIFEPSQVEKKVRVVSTIDYLLED